MMIMMIIITDNNNNDNNNNDNNYNNNENSRSNRSESLISSAPFTVSPRWDYNITLAGDQRSLLIYFFTRMQGRNRTGRTSVQGF